MKRLEEVDRISGQGYLSGADVAPFLVGYDISVRQTIFERAGVEEARGAFDISAVLDIPGGNMNAMLKRFSQNGDAGSLPDETLPPWLRYLLRSSTSYSCERSPSAIDGDPR